MIVMQVESANVCMCAFCCLGRGANQQLAPAGRKTGSTKQIQMNSAKHTHTGEFAREAASPPYVLDEAAAAE